MARKTDVRAVLEQSFVDRPARGGDEIMGAGAYRRAEVT